MRRAERSSQVSAGPPSTTLAAKADTRLPTAGRLTPSAAASDGIIPATMNSDVAIAKMHKPSRYTVAGIAASPFLPAIPLLPYRT